MFIKDGTCWTCLFSCLFQANGCGQLNCLLRHFKTENHDQEKKNQYRTSLHQMLRHSGTLGSTPIRQEQEFKSTQVGAG